MVQKTIICLLCIVSLLLIVLPGSAAEDSEDFEESDYAANIIQKGSDLIIINAADGLGSIWKNNTFTEGMNETQDVTDEYGATRGAITALVTVNPHPDQIPAIKNFEQNTKSEWIFLIAVYILSYVSASRLERSKRTIFTRALNNYDLSDNRFVAGVFACMASYAAPRVLLITYDVCTVVSKWAMIEVMDYIEPSAENAYMYFMMMIGETLVAVPFIIRQWVLDVGYAASRFLIVLFIMGFFQDEILWMWEKFKKILALQPVCVFVACIIMAAIKANGLENVGGAYVIMFFVIACFIKEWMVPGVVTRTVNRAARGAYMVVKA